MTEATQSAQLVLQYPNILIGFAIYGVLAAIATIFLLGSKWGARTKKVRNLK